MSRRSVAWRAHPLTHRECLILDRIGRDRTHKDVAAELGASINTVANLAAKAYRKLGAHGAVAAVLAHRDAHLVQNADRLRTDARADQGGATRASMKRAAQAAAITEADWARAACCSCSRLSGPAAA